MPEVIWVFFGGPAMGVGVISMEAWSASSRDSFTSSSCGTMSVLETGALFSSTYLHKFVLALGIADEERIAGSVKNISRCIRQSQNIQPFALRIRLHFRDQTGWDPSFPGHRKQSSGSHECAESL